MSSDFVLLELRLSDKVSAIIFEAQVRRRIPGLKLTREATRTKEILYKAVSESPKDFVELGIAIEIYLSEIDHAEHSNSNTRPAPAHPPLQRAAEQG